MHVFYTPDIAVTCEMPEEEAAHCLRVLRLGSGRRGDAHGWKRLFL